MAIEFEYINRQRSKHKSVVLQVQYCSLGLEISKIVHK